MKKKGLFAVLLFLLMLSFSLSASAEKTDYKEFSSDSTFKPVSYSSHKSVSSVTLYGNADYLCMKSFKDTKESQEFRVEIYSDSKRKKKVLEYADDFKKGTKYNDIVFDLTELKSKTYYATSYVIKRKNGIYGSYEKDPDTVTKFKIVVKRDGAKIKNMKTIMYGYENSVEGPIIYWYSVPGATKYYVYKKTDGKFKKIKTVKATGEDFSYYIDKSLKDKNATAYYKVKAVSGTGKTPLSADDLKVKALKTPKVTLEYDAKGGVKISWSKVSDGVTYNVYMATVDSDWMHVKKTQQRSYVHEDNHMVNGSYLQSGTVYFFTVVAEKGDSTSGYENNKAILYFKNPEIKSIKKDSGNLVLSWNAVKNVESYNVYRRVDGTQEWTKIGNTRNCYFTDSDLKKNTLYNYCVKSVIGSYECIYSAYQRSNAMLEVPVMNSVTINGAGYPVVAWNKIDGASYRVLRKGEGEEIWWEVGRTNRTSFTDKKDIENGKKYSYKVCTYIYSVFGGCYESEKSNATDPVACYLPISNAAPAPLKEGVRINWGQLKNVEGYNVYRKIKNGEYTLLGNTATNYFDDYTLVKDTDYIYKIVCVAGGEEKSLTTTEIPVKLSSQYVTALTDTAKTDEPWFCSIKPAEYNSTTKYTVYTKVNGVWEAVKEQSVINEALRFKKNEGSFINEYTIASVSADGTVTLAGDENAFSLSYIVPTVITAKPDHQSYTATLTWKPIEGAEKYIIYSDNKQVAVLNGTETSYKTGILKPSQNIYYSVGVVRGNSEFVSDLCKVYIIKKPKVEAKVDSQGIHLSWDYCGNRDYTVYRKTESDGEWEYLTKLRYTLYDDKTAVHGKTYYYTVLPDGGAKDEKGTKVTYIKPVKMKKATFNKKTAVLNWKKSSVADYYIVSKKVSGKWKEVYRTKDNNTVKYTDKTVKAGERYHYRVYAVKDGVKSEGAGEVFTFMSPPTGLKATAVSSGVKLTFNKVSGAKKYVVYRKSGKGEYKKLKTLKSSSRSYTDKKIKKGTKYTYYVKAYNGSLYSAVSSKVSYKK